MRVQVKNIKKQIEMKKRKMKFKIKEKEEKRNSVRKISKQTIFKPEKLRT